MKTQFLWNRPSFFVACSARLLIAVLIIANARADSALPVPVSGNVTLALDEYNKLLELARQPSKKPDAPPFPLLLKSAQINLEVKEENVVGTIALDGEVLSPAGRKVPLVNGIVVLNAQQNGAELPLLQENGVVSALLPGPGEFAITLKTGMPLTIEAGRASFTLPVPSSGAARFTLSVPGDQTAVNINPGLITAKMSRNGHTTIEATLVPGQSSTIWWAARLGTQAPEGAPVQKEVRFLSDIKTLISVNDSEVAMAALVDVTVVQGDPSQFLMVVPDGYELSGATGPTLIGSEMQNRTLRLRISSASLRNHQFLISLVKTNAAAKSEVPLIGFQGTQRETGEVLIEAEGTVELSAAERGGLRRMDMKETSPYLRSLARASLYAAFRYQKKSAETPALAIEWTRFPDSSVLSAVAQQALVTTLVTSEGRSLTEVKLTLKNQSQPFLKLGLPAGASILSAEVAGEKVKPVQGGDGSRVPLLRPGFRPTDSYTVSFVFMHAGAPFGKKGGADLALPKMDMPIALLEWEVFLPKQFKIADFGGDALSAHLMPAANNTEDTETAPGDLLSLTTNLKTLDKDAFLNTPGQLGGIVTDPAGAVIPRATVHVVHLATGSSMDASSNLTGRWALTGIPSGRVRITVAAQGFQNTVRELDHDANRGTPFSVALQVGNVSQTVEITANSAMVRRESQQVERNARQNAAAADVAASPNVADLQKRVVGVLPIAVNVPRTGNSYRFVRPLVIDEETRLTFSYRSK